MDAAAARKTGVFLAHFSLAKGMSFFGLPALGLALGEQTYGALEFALAVGPVAALALTFGAPYAAMQILLMRVGRRIDDLLAVAVLACAVAALMAAAALRLAGAPRHFEIAAAATALFGLQAVALGYARASSWRIGNLWIEHIPSIAVMTAAVGLIGAGLRDDLGAYALLFAMSALAVAASAAAVFWRTRQPAFGERLRELARIGLPMASAALVGTWILSSGRIWLQIAGADECLFAYAYSFRLATFLTVIVALAMGAFSAELYRMPTRRFDRVYALMTLGLLAAALAYVAARPEVWAARRLSPAKARLLVEQPLVLLAPIQVYFLASQPLLDMRIARARLAGRAARATLTTALVCLGIVIVLHVLGHLTPLAIVVVAVAQQAAALAVGHLVLARRGLPLRRAAIATAAGAAALVAWASLAAANMN